MRPRADGVLTAATATVMARIAAESLDEIQDQVTALSTFAASHGRRVGPERPFYCTVPARRRRCGYPQ